MEVQSSRDWVSGPCPSGQFDDLQGLESMVEVRMWAQRDCPRGHGHRQLLLTKWACRWHSRGPGTLRFQSSAGKVNVLSTDRVENVLSLLLMLNPRVLH